jgi:hypothetical protein
MQSTGQAFQNTDFARAAKLIEFGGLQPNLV